MASEKILWIGGWAIPQAYILDLAKKQFPAFAHVCLLPNSIVLNRKHSEKYDWVIAYSLGSFLILWQAELFNPRKGIILLAPFLDLKKESGLGGQISVPQLRYLQKLLRENPVNAINDFYNRAGLDLNCADSLPYAQEDLEWGIKVLIEHSARRDKRTFAQVIVGEDDPLINARKLSRFFSGMDIIPGAGHNLKELLPFVAIKRKSVPHEI